jgi:hypothetical protein
MTEREQRIWDTAFATSFTIRTSQQRPLIECEVLAAAEAGDCLRAFRKLVAEDAKAELEKVTAETPK